jgi:large conductance mechanosensitive channel
MVIRSIGNKAGGFFSEFWKFAAKGNAIQLAVAVVLGGAFGAIVNSLVADIITPFISLLTNSVDISSLSLTLREDPALVIGYGKLLQASLNFLIVGLAIFGLFKLFQGVIDRFQKKEEGEPPVAISTEEKLLSEILEVLKDLV